MDDRVDFLFPDCPSYKGGIANIAFDKNMAFRIREVVQILDISSVCKQIYINHPDIRILTYDEMDKVRSDKTSPAGNQEVLHLITLLFKLMLQ
jgi:hypothetical protein